MSCENIPSIADLEKTKLHADDFGRLIGGTESGYSTNGVTGKTRPTYDKTIADLGFKPGSGDFTTGFTVQPGQRDYAWYDPVSKNWYSYLGIIPSSGYVVMPDTNPVGNIDWKPVTDSILRQELSQPSGSSIVGFQQSGVDSVPRTAQDKMRERVTPQDKGAVGDGVTNDQSAFTALEAMPAGTFVDLLGKTYLVDTLPLVQFYFNGFIKHSIDGYIYNTPEGINVAVKNRAIIIGDGAGAAMQKWIKFGQSGHPYGIIAVGDGALDSNTIGRNTLAIGHEALQSQVNGRYNVAIGDGSQYFSNSDDGAVVNGTRNTSIGSNTLRFNVVGFSNCSMGRNSGQCITNSSYNTALGANAMAGYGPVGIDGATIENQSPLTAPEQTHIGANSGLFSNRTGNTSLGFEAANLIKTGQITAIGHQAGASIEKDRHFDSREKLFISKSGSYSWVGNTITCTVTAHGLAVGYTIKAGIGSTEANYLNVVSVVDANTFTITTPYIKTASGSMNFSEVVTNTVLPAVTGVTAIGTKAMVNANNCSNSVAIGENSQFASQGGFNVSVGGLSLTNNTSGTNIVAIGYSAGRSNTTGSSHAILGDFAGGSNTTGNRLTAIGRNALRNKQDGSAMDGLDNVTGLGSEARVSGSNQVQIGDSATTTYVYGTVQNRSDIRDKTDIQDTQLGIDFIMGLRPVDGRWDMREDYTEEYQVQVGIDEDAQPIFETRLRPIQKDGSKKRERFHHWFIAQEVKELCDSLGVEFGGYQDHSVNGGCDVLSLGYDEFIPPAVKAIQQCWTRLDELEKRIAALE